jgi:hypothetical protein
MSRRDYGDADPREAKTLGEAADNGDGTFDGLRALSWLSSVLGGKGLPLSEVEKIAQEVKAKRTAKGGDA